MIDWADIDGDFVEDCILELREMAKGNVDIDLNCVPRGWDVLDDTEWILLLINQWKTEGGILNYNSLLKESIILHLVGIVQPSVSQQLYFVLLVLV